jgi:hypothetical protein
LFRQLLGRLLGLPIGTKLFLGLRHNLRRGLRVRWRTAKMHCRQSSGGKQQQTKFCHDGLGPRKILGKFLAGRLGRKACHKGLTINKQALGRIVAGSKAGFVFVKTPSPDALLFITHSADRFKPGLHIVPAAYPHGPDQDQAPPVSQNRSAGIGRR